MMALSITQRLDRLKHRTAELDHWRERETLALEGWRFDSAPIAIGAFWPRRDGVVRLEAAATVPEHWPLQETRLVLELGGESLVTMIPAEGTPCRFGFDPNHREFPAPAARFRIEAECVARLPFGEPVREPRLGAAHLAWIDGPVHRLALLLRQVEEAATALDGHEVVPHLLAAGERTLVALDWPSATAAYVSRTAAAPEQQRIWQLPPLEPDPAGLRQDHRASVVTAHDALVADLRRLRERFPPQGAIAITGHAHIDLAWLWPYAETRRKMRRTFHTARQLLERFPDFVFNQSTAAYYDQIERDDPGLFTAIATHVKSGRWETIGGMWVEPDTNMPTGESLVRQILYGQRYFERTFGVLHSVCWLPDCFGFSPALPQLLRQGGMRSFFTTKVNWSETNKFPYDLFWWEGLDGSRVLSHTFDNPQGGYNGLTAPAATVPTWRNFRGKALHDESLLAIGYGDGGGGVTPEMLERQAQLADFPALPSLRPARVDAFFERIHDRVPPGDLPVWAGEMYLELHRATQGRTKRLHRQAERALITAETLASLVAMLGGPHPNSLEPAWHCVLKNEFHDILPGSGVREVYEDAERELAETCATGSASQLAALQSLLGLLAPGPVERALVVVNPELHARPIRLVHDGEPLASDVMVPPLGIMVLNRATLAPSTGVSASVRHLENAFVRVGIGTDGTLSSLFDKRHSREALAGRGNQLWAYPMDKPRSWDAWDIEEDYAARGIELTDLVSIDVLESGPHRGAVRIVRRFRDSSVTQIYRLWANSPRLDIQTDLDWHDRRVLLRALVPVGVHSDAATFECAFGVVRRPTHRNTSWQQAQFEVPAHRFVDLSEPGYGVAMLNDGKYGHSAHGNMLGLSLLRSPIYPDPLADEGPQSFTYALLAHAGDWCNGGVREEALDLNQPLLAASATGLATATHTPITVAGIAAGLAGLKAAEDGAGLVLRVYEPAGARGQFSVAAGIGWVLGKPLDLLERMVDRASDRAATPDLLPFEVRSWALARRPGSVGSAYGCPPSRAS